MVPTALTVPLIYIRRGTPLFFWHYLVKFGVKALSNWPMAWKCFFFGEIRWHSFLLVRAITCKFFAPVSVIHGFAFILKNRRLELWALQKYLHHTLTPPHRPYNRLTDVFFLMLLPSLVDLLFIVVQISFFICNGFFILHLTNFFGQKHQRYWHALLICLTCMTSVWILSMWATFAIAIFLGSSSSFSSNQLKPLANVGRRREG